MIVGNSNKQQFTTNYNKIDVNTTLLTSQEEQSYKPVVINDERLAKISDS